MLPKAALAVGLFNVVMGSYEVFLSQTEAYDVSKGGVLGYYDIADTMHFELDITLNSWNTGGGWNNVIHGSPNDHDCCNVGDRMPGIWLSNSGSETKGFYMMFDHSQDGDPYFWTNTAVTVGNTYHVTMDVNQTWFTVTVDGVTIKDESKPSHPTYTNVKLYASDPWYTSADVTITNLLISNMAGSPTDCDAVHIDDFLVDCSVEWVGHDSDIEDLKSNVVSMQNEINDGAASIAAFNASIDAMKADIQLIVEQLEKIGDLPEDGSAASVIGGNMDWYQHTAGDSMVEWNGINMMIAGLVIANVVTMIVLAVVCCGDGSSNKHRYGAVGVASDSELVNMK